MATTRFYNRVHKTYKRDTMDNIAQMNRETTPLGPTGHILHKVTLPRLGTYQIHLIDRKQCRKEAKLRR